ncbi:MAG: hypothetical protein ACKVP7_11145 [Hyphomicrobiaceae bacterium]
MQAAVRSRHEDDARQSRSSNTADSVVKAALRLHHIRWGATGYAAGLLLVVPFVLWVTVPEPPESRAVTTAPLSTPGTTVPVLVRGPTPIGREQARTTTIVAATNLEAEVVRERLAAAASLIAARSILPARAKLQPLVEAGDGEALFLLAGTFDPIQLATLGVTDVRAEAERARHLYMQALMAGIEAARGRLELLK